MVILVTVCLVATGDARARQVHSLELTCDEVMVQRQGLTDSYNYQRDEAKGPADAARKQAPCSLPEQEL